MSVRFGTFQFEPVTRQLLGAGGEPIHLTRKAFDLLALLIAGAPRVFTKAELHQQLWPGTFVSDGALVALVKELRRGLRTAQPAATFVRTVHGIGYAFVGLPEPARGPGAADLHHWVVSGDRRIPLEHGENVIGRGPTAYICLDAAGVSRRHARIVVSGDDAQVEDLGSKNGTSVRSVRVIGGVRLTDGDSIEIGPVSILYRVAAGGVSTETVPSAVRSD